MHLLCLLTVLTTLTYWAGYVKACIKMATNGSGNVSCIDNGASGKNSCDMNCVKNGIKKCKALGGYEANCTQQAEIWLQRPEGADRLLLANGQYRPTLTIDANTWVRLRLGFISSAQWL